MGVRKIKIYSTNGSSGTIETNVQTLGELKPLLSQREISYSGMKMLVGETRNELNVDEAVLPTGDFKLYLMPQKTKSGSRESEIYEEIADLYEELAEIQRNKAVSAPSSFVDEDAEAMADLRRLNSM